MHWSLIKSTYQHHHLYEFLARWVPIKNVAGVEPADKWRPCHQTVSRDRRSATRWSGGRWWPASTGIYPSVTTPSPRNIYPCNNRQGSSTRQETQDTSQGFRFIFISSEIVSQSQQHLVWLTNNFTIDICTYKPAFASKYVDHKISSMRWGWND